MFGCRLKNKEIYNPFKLHYLRWTKLTTTYFSRQLFSSPHLQHKATTLEKAERGCMLQLAMADSYISF